ncbi:hypothetical protein CR513_19016, partial [Mucuna pruriens]
MDRNMIDVASGGALMDKTPTAIRHLILNMASNTCAQDAKKTRTKGIKSGSQEINYGGWRIHQ